MVLPTGLWVAQSPTYFQIKTTGAAAPLYQEKSTASVASVQAFGQWLAERDKDVYKLLTLGGKASR